jgi:hypothetical protein
LRYAGVAQWKSEGLIIPRPWVRFPPPAPRVQFTSLAIRIRAGNPPLQPQISFDNNATNNRPQDKKTQGQAVIQAGNRKGTARGQEPGKYDCGEGRSRYALLRSAKFCDQQNGEQHCEQGALLHIKCITNRADREQNNRRQVTFGFESLFFGLGSEPLKPATMSRIRSVTTTPMRLPVNNPARKLLMTSPSMPTK